jgi:hypothetical protein
MKHTAFVTSFIAQNMNKMLTSCFLSFHWLAFSVEIFVRKYSHGDIIPQVLVNGIFQLNHIEVNEWCGEFPLDKSEFKQLWYS